MAKKSQQTQQSWNEISGKMRIYGNKFGEGKKAFLKYSTSIAIKNDDDEYVNYYFDIRFASKCEEYPTTTGEVWIDVKDAFFSVNAYKDKNGNDIVKPVIVVMDCTII